MDRTEFTKIFELQIDRCKGILQQKGNIYSEGTDRLGNFKKAANLQEISPIAALLGMYSKHIVCLSDLISRPIESVTSEQWDETITDSINYLILLRALITEGREVFKPIPNTSIGGTSK